MTTLRAALAACLVLAAAVPGRTAPLAASWDRKYADEVSSVQPGPGDTVYIDGVSSKKIVVGTSDAVVRTAGRFAVDFELKTTSPVELEPAATGPCVRENAGKGEGEFELLDASGKVRYRGARAASPGGQRTDRACRRFLYVDRKQKLVAVDLSTFRDETLGDAPMGLEGTKRVVIVRERDKHYAYDVEYGVRCGEGYLWDLRCVMPERAAGPGLDEFYRPLPAVRVYRPGNKAAFRVVDAAGTELYRGSQLLYYSDDQWALSPDGRWFAYANDGRRIVLVDLKDATKRVLGPCPPEYGCAMRFSAGGRFLFASPKAFAIPDGREVARPTFAYRSTPDDRWSVVQAESSLYLYDLAAGATAVRFPGQFSLSDVKYSPTGRLALVRGSASGASRRMAIELPGGRVVATPPDVNGGTPVFSPDERYLFERVDYNGTCQLTDLRYGGSILVKFPEAVYGYAFSGSGRWIATTGGKAWLLRRGPVQRAVIAELDARRKAVEAELASGRAAELAALRAAAAAKSASLRPAKGEFESGAEYAARLKAADEQDALAAAETRAEEARVGALWDARERERGGKAREDLEAALDEEIIEPAAVAVGSYDADAEEFDATVSVDGSTRTIRLSVARKDAPAAKGRAMTGEAVYRHALEGGVPVRVDLRLAVKDKELGEVYAWSSGAGAVKRSRTAPSAPARLEVKAGFADADGDGRLGAGEGAKLSVVLTNTGAGASYGASVLVSPAAADGLSYAARHFAGEIAPGASKSVTVPLKALADARDGSRELMVSASDANGFSSDPLKVVFETRARRGARLSVSSLKVADSSGDGIVTPGELAEVVLRVRNDGEGAARAASVALAAKGGDAFIQGEPRRALGSIVPGGTAEARFTVFSNTALSGDRLKYSAALSDGADAWESPVEIPLRRALGAARELVVRGRDLSGAGGAPSDAVDKPSVRGTPRPDAYAVVLGVEDYPKAARVTHARRDAAAFRAFATDVLGVPDDAAHLFYLDEGVTLGELRKAFSPNGWLARRAGPDSEVFVFYAGHGAPSLDGKSAFLVPQDGDPNYAAETGFPIDDMLKALDGSKARAATVWLDACFSGADRESRPLLADARPLMMRAEPVVPAGKVALFSAASGAQVSSAYPEKRHGLFTWFALRGLDGEADADKDGALTAGELSDFLGARVSRAAGELDREQTPGYRGDRSRVLARYRRPR